MRKSKNRYFYHIFVSPGDAPEAITLNVIWIERKFDAYKLSRCMCPSNYNRFWDRARYLWKNRHFIIPLAFDAPVRGGPDGISAPPLERKNYNGVATRQWKNFEDMSIRFDLIHECDGQTDGRTDGRTLHDSKDRAYASHRAVIKLNWNIKWFCLSPKS